MEGFTAGEKLSKGSFGVIYKVKHKATGTEYALKVIPLENLSTRERQEALDEVRILAKLDHPFIIRHHKSFVRDDSLHILMDLADRGSLHEVHRDGRISEDRLWKYCIQILLAVEYIHSRDIIHRDIKLLNLFLDGQDDVKLGDFGIARAQGSQTQLLKTLVGTPFYLSPEICNDKPYNSASDIWAVGVCLYELCMGKHPFTAKNEGALIRKIIRGDYERPTGYSSSLLSLVVACLTYHCKNRPSATELLSRKIVKQKAHQLEILPLKIPKITKSIEFESADMRDQQEGSKHLYNHKVQDMSNADMHQKADCLTSPSQQCHKQLNIEENMHSTNAKRGGQGSLAGRLIAAGIRTNTSQHSAPFGRDEHGWDSTFHQTPHQDVWGYEYARPQFARRRCPDLMVTGPDPRANLSTTSGKAVKPPGFYAYECSSNSSTTYMRGSQQRS